MPVGMDAIGLKSSLSLSSLPPGTPSDSPEHVLLRVRNDRPYHSLTKQKNRRAEQTASWRKSWGSGISNDDRDFWEAFQADYDYLMAQTMVPKLVPTSVDSSTPQTPPVWSLQECLDRFAQLYSWLKRVQDLVYVKETAEEDWTGKVMEELHRHRCKLQEFAEGARQLVRQCPHVEEEVAWRVRYVQDSWQAVEAVLGARGGADEARCLRRWLCAMEQKLEPVSFTRNWTEAQLEAKRAEHSVLHRDIEAHGAVVASVVRSCQRAEGAALERQYHNLLLRCYEWQCHLEALLAGQVAKNPLNACVSSDSDGEPAAKCLRLSHEVSPSYEPTVESMESASTVLRRRDVSNRMKNLSPTRRCGIQLSDVVLDEDDSANCVPASVPDRTRRNIANFEIKHEDTESEAELKSVNIEDGLSSASEGWSFELTPEKEEESKSKRERRRVVARSLTYTEEVSKTASVQELVEGAENLVRIRSICAIESRDASGESDSDGGLESELSPRLRYGRPHSLCLQTESLPASRAWSASETALNRTDSTRRRRVKSRKKFNSLRKLGCDRDQAFPCMTKSESFTGVDGQTDSSNSSRSESLTTGDITLVQGDETGEDAPEEVQIALPEFRLGPEAGVVTASESDKLGGEEPSSLNTEDCWDDYQEKYPSEAYSEEVADGNTLLNCDDYDMFLQSRGPQRRRRRRARRYPSDTESEPEELRSLLDRSLSQLREVENALYGSQLCIPYEELMSKCRDNISCLKLYLDVLSAEKFIISDATLRNVLEQWQLVEGRLEGHSEQLRMRLENEMEQFRCELALLTADNDRPRFQTRLQLEEKIAQVKNDLNGIRERKPRLQQLNASVHHYVASFTYHEALMKEQIVQLYHQWTTSFDSVSSQLCWLQQVAQDWQDLECNLVQLHTDLLADQDTLRKLDSALTGLDTTDFTVDPAKCGLILDHPSLLLTEGSLSDSGISDSGSEIELNEREKRLATLKNLARHLEAILEPGSQELRGMAKRIEEAEAELRGLQKTCREMIVRSTSGAEHLQIDITTPKLTRIKGKRNKSLTSNGESKKSSWLWRVVRSALPFQLALVALLCVACLLEPQCCDAINNLGLSHATQFRYMRGPPPV